MAKRRSKKDRVHAKQHRSIEMKSVADEVSKVEVSEEVKKSSLEKSYLEEIFAYDPKLIIKDLRKTFLVVLFVLLVLLTIALLYT